MSYFLAPALVQLRDQINAAHPGRDKASDGWIGDAAHNARKSDHNPDWSAGGIVRAIDVDEDLYGPGRSDRHDPATPLVLTIIRDPRVAYVIYEGAIWTPARGWQPYTAAGKAGWFNPHKMHFHVSLRHGKTWDHDRTPWNINTEEIPVSAINELKTMIHNTYERAEVIEADQKRRLENLAAALERATRQGADTNAKLDALAEAVAYLGAFNAQRFNDLADWLTRSVEERKRILDAQKAATSPAGQPAPAPGPIEGGVHA